MRLESLRREVCHTAREVARLGLTHGSSGNVSARDPETGLVAVTPSGLPFERLEPEDVPLVGLDDALVDGARRPSTERALHLAAYRARKDVLAVVHTHSPHATALAALDGGLPAVLAETVAIFGGPVPLAPYRPPGTQELADVTVAAAGAGWAALMANHGAVALGANLQEALEHALTLEASARVYLLALATGRPVRLVPEADFAGLRRTRRKTYGQRPG